MTLITGQVSDVGMNDASGVFYARAAEFRGDGAVVVTPAPATFTITGGALSADIAPGPTVITLHVGPVRKDWFVNIPETDIGLGDLIAEYTTYEPAVVSAAIAARDAAILAESEAKQAAIDAEAKRVAAETAANLTGQDRLHVDNVRALLDEAYDESQAGMTLPPRLMESALNATYPAKATGPRNLPRVKDELRPILSMDQTFPTQSAPYRILGVDGSTMWAWGRDCTLRRSLNGGRTWTRMWRGWTTGKMGRYGAWLKTASGALITTWHPDNNDPASILRSENGTSWSVVVPPKLGVKYLGPTSICQNTTTGTIWLGEYVNSAFSANPSFDIKKSTDDGATWTVWKTIQRDPALHADAMFHCHMIQQDPITGDVYIACGDAPAKAGIYRVLPDESDWEPIATNEMLDTASGIWGGAVGMAFFPNGIAWGVDQSYTSGVAYMPRAEIGKPTPDVQLVRKLNSTGFYTARASDDNRVWLFSASQEDSSAAKDQRIDNAVHLYRVEESDLGVTVDEAMSIPMYAGGASNSFSWVHPLGGPIQNDPNGLMWLGCNIYGGPTQADPTDDGFQFTARFGWGTDTMIRPDKSNLTGPHLTASALVPAVNAGGYRDFGATAVPQRETTLYIIEASSKNFAANVVPLLEVWTVSPYQLATMEQVKTIPGYTDNKAAFRTVSARRDEQATSGAYVYRITGLTAGTEILFRVHNIGSATGDAGVSITYAWGM